MSISAMKQALEALEFFCEYGAIDRPFERIAELKQALAEAEKQDPVLNKLDWWALIDENQRLRAELKFNTEPPKPRPLIEEEIEKCCFRADAIADDHTDTWKWTMIFAREIESAHGIKGEA